MKTGDRAPQHTLRVTRTEVRNRLRERNTAAPFFLNGCEDFEIGDRIRLTLEIVETAQSIILPGEVIWRRRGSRKLSGGVGVVVPVEAVEQLESWMREVLGDAPAQETRGNTLSIGRVKKPTTEERIHEPPTRESLPYVRAGGQTALPPSIESAGPPGLATEDFSVEGQIARNPQPGEYVAARFECIEEIGRGGVGVIYRCRHSILNKRVALKMLQENLPEKESIGQLFLNEARILSSLETQHIPAVFDFGVDPHFGPYFVMEHLVGETLAVHIETLDAELDEATFLPIALNLVIALDAVHKEGVIHCDLKPENIWMARESNLIGERHYMKIFDFGISRTMDKPGDKETKTMVAGTPDFMAPEQIMGEKLDRRTDLYALGVIFYQLLTGDVPFASDDPYQILRSHIEVQPRAIRDHRRKAIDRRIDALVMRLLAKDAADRYPSAEVVYHSLRFILGAS
ncbi:MAG: serine/threonine protein kinase [Myxococcales bacterium]|nr:serine/threonine protein kinase [Myxococcales bacterium]